MHFAIVSYYTEGTLYEKEAEGLIASCRHWGLEHYVEGVKNLGAWDRNCCYKPTYILQKMEKLKKPVVWIDCDAVIVQKPVFFDGLSCDLSLRIDVDRAMDHPSRVLGGTIFFQYNKKTLALVKKWKRECAKRLKNADKEIWDQACLRDLIQQKNTLKIQKLPLAYCRIFDWPRDQMPHEETFILHFQASRLFKKIINQEVAPFPFLQECNMGELKSIRYLLKT